MTKIIDVNKHGIRREIDHQWKPKKKRNKSRNTDATKDIDISIENTINVRGRKE